MAVTYADGLPACEQSPIQVVTGCSVDVCVSMGVLLCISHTSTTDRP